MDINSQIEELQKQGRAADKEDRERAELFAAMLQTPAWKFYVSLLDKRIQAHADVLMGPAVSVDRAIALEYVKGAMSGLVMARDLPSVIVTAIKDSLPARDGEDDA